MTKTDGYAKFRSPWLRRFVRKPLNAVLMHWAVQSLFYMDRTERWFKIMLDVVMTLWFGSLLNLWLPWYLAWLVAFLLAHTLNFLFNGQLWGVLKFFDCVNQTYEQFAHYIDAFTKRVECEPSIKEVLVFGSISRQEWSPSSDFDARIIRHPGLINGLRACWFLLLERSYALLRRFPLDVYIVDSQGALEKLSPNEVGIPLHVYRNGFSTE